MTKSRVPFGTDLENPGEEGAPPIHEQPDPFAINAAEAIPKGYRFHIGELSENDGMKCIQDFHEICTGVYIIEYSVTITRTTMPNGYVAEGGGTRMHFLEIVSWKSEELPKALKEFLNARFQMN